MDSNLKAMVAPLLFWYDENARILPWRENPQPYRVWISEIMLQQTRVEAGKAYFERFLIELPDIPALAAVADDKLMKLWEGLGYYNRARNLKKAAQILMADYGGSLPANFNALMALPGIGEYTAGAIGSIAFGLPVPCVDGNVLRVITRLTADGRSITERKVKKEITEQIRDILPEERPGDFNQSLMELGALVCLPNGAPLCENCPLEFCCQSRAEGTMLSFPVKPEKKKRRKEKKTIFLLLKGNQVALRKRDTKGLLAGLCEFPNEEGHLSLEEAQSYLTQKGLSFYDLRKAGCAQHIFSHVQWEMIGYVVHCNDAVEESYLWADLNQLKTQIALPSAFSAFLAQAVSHLSQYDSTS